MCLAVPIEIIEIADEVKAKGLLNGVEVEFSVELLENPRIGDYAIVHAGVAIELLDVDEAHKTIKMISEALSHGPD